WVKAKKINRRGRGGSQRVVFFSASLCVLRGFPNRQENNKKSQNIGTFYNFLILSTLKFNN
ncbi:MAG: hypothetical protein MUP85_01970, partial [Candidatus Lokiarchaeota archaeon]|nr:hypothetical protein [Candidatus Lokiarchaeota archaeon]